VRSIPTLSRGLGRLPAKLFEQAVAGGVAAHEMGEQLQEVSDSLTRAGRRQAYTLAEITGSTAIVGVSNRWAYDWTEVELTATGVQARSGGFTSTTQGKAHNLCELVNNDSGLEGPGWNLATAPAGFDIKPIDECVVQLWATIDSTGEQRWFFQMANVLDGACS